MNLSKLTQHIWVVIFGASTGVTLMEFGPKGVFTHFEGMKIPWQGDEKTGLYWPTEWFLGLMTLIRGYLQKGDLLGITMFGADIVAFKGTSSTTYPILHYGSQKRRHLEGGLNGVDPFEAYIATNGAHVAPHQPLAALRFMLEQDPDFAQADGVIVPMATHMLNTVSDDYHFVYDAEFLQSLGLGTADSRQFYRERLFPNISADRLFPDHRRIFVSRGLLGSTQAPIPVCDGNAILEKDGIYYMPVLHDAVSRQFGLATGTKWFIWSGSWVGTGVQVDESIIPTRATYDIGVAFEGLGPNRSAITNSGKFGPIYKRLIKLAYSTYEEMSEIAYRLILDGWGKILDLRELPEDEDDAVGWILTQNEGDPTRAAASFIQNVTLVIRDDMQKLASALSLPMPTQISIFGGWSQNKAFLEHLRRLEIEVFVHPMAMYATHYGLAAEVLRRYLLSIGEKVSFAEALAMLPEIK